MSSVWHVVPQSTLDFALCDQAAQHLVSFMQVPLQLMQDNIDNQCAGDHLANACTTYGHKAMLAVHCHLLESLILSPELLVLMK